MSLPLFDWRPPPAEVIPFPVVRRRGFCEKHAAAMAALSPEKAARHLDRQLSVQRDVMLRRGISADRIERELGALRTRIVAEVAASVRRA